MLRIAPPVFNLSEFKKINPRKTAGIAKGRDFLCELHWHLSGYFGNLRWSLAFVTIILARYRTDSIREAHVIIR